MPAAVVSFSDMGKHRDGPDTDVRRDEYRRQKLTDVEEEVDENETERVEKRPETPSTRKTRNHSASSNISMDTLWDLHPRRLSEAGLRRHSDTSVVLTEDTDCFIIGMKVWVGGTKPGQIAYLGETQFAPGEWAGIVLDEPIGKNDGSVSGTRYFQCEPKRGVFSRLTRLTLAPLPEAAEASSMKTPSTNGTRRSPTSPTGSTRSLLHRAPPSLNTSSTSLSSAVHHDFKVGDRVIIQSSQGSKPGTLRYIGTTDFAKGEWCGVELDDPLGKNDGAVEGKRYFTCQPRFGLFTPVAKVSKSPSSRKPSTQCVVHKGGSATSSIRRAGSRESITSMTSMTSATSSVRRKPLPQATSTPVSKTPLQDVLREKEHHIEQLMKEREFDRNEITRAVKHAEDIEGRLLSLQQEYEKYRFESESKFRDQHSTLSQLEKKCQNLTSQLEDEKKKLEDAQFRFEEEILTKDEVEASNKNNLLRIAELEQFLKDERLKNEKLEQETKRMFETEEFLSKIQEEMDALQKSQEQVNKKILVKEVEVIALTDKLTEMNILLTEEKKRNEKKDANIESLVAENNTLTQEKDKIIGRLKEELDEANKLLKEKHIGNELTLLKELKKVEIDLSAKNFDCETQTEKVKELENKILQLETELKDVKTDIPESEKELKWKQSMEELKNILKSTVFEFIKVKKENALQILEKEMALREKDIKLSYEILEIEKLKTDFNQTIAEITQSSKFGKERYMKQIEARNKQIDELLNSLQNTSKELVTRHTTTARLQEEISEKNQLIIKLKSELEMYTNVKLDQNNYIKKLTEQLKVMSQKANEWERKYHNAEQMILQLKELKQQHESQFRSIIDASKDSNTQLAIFNEELRRTEQNLENVRLEMAKKLDTAYNIEQELKFNLKTATERFEIEKAHLEKQLKSSQEAEGILEEKLRLSTSEALQAQEKLNQQIIDLMKNLERIEIESKKQQDASSDKIRELEQILEIRIAEGERASSALTRRIDELTAERDLLKITVKEKTEHLIEAEEKSKTFLLNQDAMQLKEINSLKTQIDEYKQKVEESNKAIKNQSNEINTLKELRIKLEHQLNEHVQEIKNLNELKQKSEQEYNMVAQKLTETESKVAELTQQVTKLIESKTNFEIILSELRDQILNLTNEIKDLQAENSNIKNTIIEKEANMALAQNEIKQIKSEKVSLESALTEKENKIVALTAQLEEIIKEKGSTSETFAAQENKILELNMELQKNLQEKTEIANEIAEKNNTLLVLKTQIEANEQEFKTKVKDNEEVVNVLKQKIDVLEKTNSDLLKTTADKEGNIVSVTTNLQNLQTEKEQLTKTINENTQQISQLKEEIKQLGEINKNFKEQVRMLENSTTEKENKINQLEIELTQLKEKWEVPNNNPIVVELNRKLEYSNKSLQEKESEVKLLTSQIEAVNKVKGTDSEIITAQENKILDLTTQVQKLLEDKSLAQTKVTENENKITQLKEEIVNKENSLNNIIKEKEQEITMCKDKIQLLSKESETSNTATNDARQEIEKLNKRISTLTSDQNKLETTLNEKENELQKLKQELQIFNETTTTQNKKLEQLESAIQEKEAMISSLRNDLQKQKDAWEQPNDNPIVCEINKKLQENEKNLKEKETEVSLLNNKIEMVTKQNQQLQQSWQMSVQQWKEKFLNLDKFSKFTSKEYSLLEEQISSLKRDMESVEKLENGVHKDVPLMQFEEFKKQIDTDRKELHNAVKKAQLLLLEKQKELNDKENECIKLKNELNQVQEEKQTAVSRQTAEKTQKTAKDNKANICDSESYNKMLEEKELAVGQVHFLNAIIIDMQNKNEKLQSKIQLLENGVFGDSPTDMEKINFERVIPPRKYCDICEVFDEHETEDCPVQMTDTDVVAVKDPSATRVLPEPRPYCDICEVFGHDTSSCDADETY